MKPAEIADYEVQDAARALIRAEEIKANPELCKKAMDYLRGNIDNEKKAICCLEDLEDAADKAEMENG